MSSLAVAPPHLAPMLIDGEWSGGQSTTPVNNPYTSQEIGRCAVSTAQDVDSAVDAAGRACGAMAAMPGYERANLLNRIASGIEAEATSIAQLLSSESGKAIRDATAEIARSVETFRLAAGEAIRIEGRHVPLDGSAMGAGRIALMLRFPVGVVAAITPFNAPFNLTAHKIAPAIAAGNTLVLKPPPQTPLAISRMLEIALNSGCPAGAINAIHGGADIGRHLVSHLAVDFVTFTGSSAAGADIRARSGLKRVALELGGNGVTIVHGDADISVAATACARSAMRLAGQSCISVQMVLVQKDQYRSFLVALISAVRKLRLGDPLDEETDLGTLIDCSASERVERWVGEAVSAGARVEIGGHRHEAAFEPTVLTGVEVDMKVVCDEVFGPVVSVVPYQHIDEAVEHVNRSRFGLQCGLYTASTVVTFDLIRRLRVGGLIVNGTSTWRTDQLPYGGVKHSGIGREGPRYAIEDMTDQRLVVFNI